MAHGPAAAEILRPPWTAEVQALQEQKPADRHLQDFDSAYYLVLRYK
jgi:hypothetical protein